MHAQKYTPTHNAHAHNTQLTRAERVVREVLETELKYRDCLYTLVDKFQKPLQDAHRVCVCVCVCVCVVSPLSLPLARVHGDDL